MRRGKGTASQSDHSEPDDSFKKDAELQTALDEVKVWTQELKEHRKYVKSNAKEITSLKVSLVKA